MRQGTAETPDRRTRRTRTAIFAAFNRLAFSRRYDSIRAADLAAEAGVGRSTFYEHFHGKDDVLLAALDPILIPLADAATRPASRAYLRALLEHMWEQRALGRILFAPRFLPKLQRKLASLIEDRLVATPSAIVPGGLIAASAAAAQLAALRLWLLGEAACSADALARHLSEAREVVNPTFPP